MSPGIMAPVNRTTAQHNH